MRKILPLLLMLLLLAGCAGTAPSATSSAICSLKIIGLDEDMSTEKTFLEKKIALEEGDNVLDITERATHAANMTLEVTGIGEAAYVIAINQLYPGDNGKSSGWMFYVNDEMPDVGCAALIVNEGDEIRWVFVPDFDLLEW